MRRGGGCCPEEALFPHTNRLSFQPHFTHSCHTPALCSGPQPRELAFGSWACLPPALGAGSCLGRPPALLPFASSPASPPDPSCTVPSAVGSLCLPLRSLRSPSCLSAPALCAFPQHTNGIGCVNNRVSSCAVTVCVRLSSPAKQGPRPLGHLCPRAENGAGS